MQPSFFRRKTQHPLFINSQLCAKIQHKGKSSTKIQKKKKNEERNARSGRGKNQKKKGSDNCVLSQHDCCSIFTVFSDRWLRHFAREARTGDTLTAGSHFKWIFSDS